VTRQINSIYAKIKGSGSIDPKSVEHERKLKKLRQLSRVRDRLWVLKAKYKNIDIQNEINAEIRAIDWALKELS